MRGFLNHLNSNPPDVNITCVLAVVQHSKELVPRLGEVLVGVLGITVVVSQLHDCHPNLKGLSTKTFEEGHEV